MKRKRTTDYDTGDIMIVRTGRRWTVGVVSHHGWMYDRAVVDGDEVIVPKNSAYVHPIQNFRAGILNYIGLRYPSLRAVCAALAPLRKVRR